MLERTRRRAALALPENLTVTVLTRKHEPFYAALSATVQARNLVVQPDDRGTAPAILYALLRIANQAPLTSVAIFPSDYHLSDDRQFMRHVNSAFATVEARPELTVVLGMAALGPECAYGWIEPGEQICAGERPIRSVRAFVENPGRSLAIDLMRRGSLWNSLVVVARVSTLLASVMIAEPELYAAFGSVRDAIGGSGERAAIEKLYTELPEAGYSGSVFARCPVNLAVLAVSGVTLTHRFDAAARIGDAVAVDSSPKWAFA
jgi:mannose-1-phosphate guanylyltransferase